ncbi:nucleotidyltransferase domain-containing protein [Micromonospora sp. WMMD1120]|uniref:nucleotidyltransferase domain-containing protein n=1 Tax=Micromonospora sp. WMMD1120 TaxID=3016106 RepID=UPI0024176F4A|nr:nucleotidyltransferase domain-containing protein [Micromonospora sp. WMMD1120]MDG4807195.1 nucleotidyltransferase domain-containing protein [Micromonospora sp. WMMD1120]
MERLATTALKTIHQDTCKALHEPTATYLIGSHARGNADQASDLDVVILTRGDVQTAQKLATSLYQERCPAGPPLDLTVLAYDDLGHPATTDLPRIQRREVLYPLADHGRHVGGPDLAGHLNSRLIMGAAPTRAMPWVFTRRVRGLPEQLQPTAVSGPPVPDDDFLGYPRDGRVKIIVSLASWIGAGIVSMTTGWDRVAAKEHVVTRLNDVDPALAQWLREVITTCRTTWGYQMPRDSRGRALLRSMCQLLHQLECDYAKRYRNCGQDRLEGDPGAR